MTLKTTTVVACDFCTHSMKLHAKGGWCSWCTCGDDKRERYWKRRMQAPECKCGHADGTHAKRTTQCKACTCKRFRLQVPA